MFQIELIELVSERGFRLPRDRYEGLQQELNSKDLPEFNLLDPGWLRLGVRPSSTEDVYVPRFIWWHGKSTPQHLEVFLQRVLPVFKGSADLVVNLRERTFHQQGYRLRKGVVSRHQVTLSLGASL